MHAGGPGGFLAVRITGEAAWIGLGIACLLLVLNRAMAGTWVPQHRLGAASSLVVDCSGGPVLNRPLTNLCSPFPLPFLLLPSSSSLIKYLSPPPLPFPFPPSATSRSLSRPVPSNTTPPPVELPFSVREKEGRRRFRFWASDKLTQQNIRTRPDSCMQRAANQKKKELELGFFTTS